MKNFRVITGYITLRDVNEITMEEENMETFPLSPFNVMTDSKEIARYLIEGQGYVQYELREQKEAPIYQEHELN